MAVIQNDDIAGYIIGHEHICKECATQEEQKGRNFDEIITVYDLDSKNRYFCDRCKKEMS